MNRCTQHVKLADIHSMAIAASLSAACATGCQHGAPTTSFQFIDEAGLPPPTDASALHIEKRRTIFVDARPIEPLARAEWPETSSIPSNPLTLKVRILVGEDGCVRGVTKSIADVATPSPFASSCFDSIKTAVDRWRFESAQLMVLEPQTDGRPLVVSSSLTGTSFEVAFTFSPHGVVDSTLSLNHHDQRR
ncbi:MAG TPA: hypothetical protein VL069_00780 [Opitutus sp.]|nr:hypothetical protein [Opitutus sp.]